jgi:leucyl aminopeptidase (aminopeptidase T)
MVMRLYEFEMARAADEVVRELVKVKPGEIFVLTADTRSDENVVNATARSIYAVGGKPMVIWLATPPGPGRMVDEFLPSEALKAALIKSDCWIEFNTQYILYSEISEYVQRNSNKLRTLCLPNMHSDVFIRLFAHTNHRVLRVFLERVREMIEEANHIRITSLAGTDVEFNNNPKHPVYSRNGYADTPGTHQLAGMIAWAPEIESINGVIVVDGSIVPQFGLVEKPVSIFLEGGLIIKISGGRQAEEFEQYLRSFNHTQMLRPAHTCVGFHPNAKLTGQIGEDERIWGGTQWGFGSIGLHLIPPDGIPAPSHIDCTCLNSSVYLDGKQITDKGIVIDSSLKKIAKTIGK